MGGGDFLEINWTALNYIETLKSVVENATTSAMPIGAAIIGITLAWKLFKKFTK